MLPQIWARAICKWPKLPSSLHCQRRQVHRSGRTIKESTSAFSCPHSNQHHISDPGFICSGGKAVPVFSPYKVFPWSFPSQTVNSGWTSDPRARTLCSCTNPSAVLSTAQPFLPTVVAAALLPKGSLLLPGSSPWWSRGNTALEHLDGSDSSLISCSWKVGFCY